MTLKPKGKKIHLTLAIFSLNNIIYFENVIKRDDFPNNKARCKLESA